MYRAMLWKETREQAAILIALLVLGTGVIAAAATLGSTSGQEAAIGDVRAYSNAGRLAVLSLAVAAGVVVGGTLFAGEKENGTIDCLDALPANRRRLWWAKLAAGLAMATAAGVALLTAGTLVGALGSQSQIIWLAWGMALVYVAFGWGLFGSTVTESTLAACAIGLVCAVVLGTPVFTIVLGVFRAVVGNQWVDLQQSPVAALWYEAPPLIAMYAVAVVPVVLAGWLFTAPDRARTPVRVTERTPRVVRRGASTGLLASLRALTWLTNRQWFVISAVGMGLALLGGLAALHEDLHLLLVWPAVASLAGVFGGVMAWADEQSKQTYKFWGERRLPLGRLWAMKLASSFLQTLAWILLAFGPSLVRELLSERQTPVLPAAFRSGLFAFGGVLNYLFIWPLYGFAFGHLAGILFRKTIVALGVGLLTAAPVAALWLPSLLAGGVHGWQLWPVPFVVLLSTRLLLRPWSADRLATLRPLATVAIVGTAAVGWTAYGLWYRAAEVPVVAAIDADLEYAQTVPQLDFEDGGRAFRSTVVVLANAFTELSRPGEDKTSVSRSDLHQLASERWPEADLRPFGSWLTQERLEQVTAALKAAADLPPGPLENPRGIVLMFPPYNDARELPAAVNMLVTRGLWKQQAGDPAEFVPCLAAALAATRNARTMQPVLIYQIGVGAEQTAFAALDVWLGRLKRRPDLVQAAVAVLEKHGRLSARDPNETFLTERMIDRNRANGIGQWAPRILEDEIDQFWRQRAAEAAKQKSLAESELLNFALVVPWERERFRRVLGLNNAHAIAGEYLQGSWLAPFFQPRPAGTAELDLRSQARRVVAVAQLNLKRYEWDHGRPAATLEELVPRYWPTVPADPFDRKPLRYRQSEGERIQVGERSDFGFPTFPVQALPVTEEERAALAGGLGGLAFVDRPRPPAPGFAADGTPEVDLDLVAAAAGGLVQAALEPLEDEVPVFAGPPGGGPLGWGRMAVGSRAPDSRAIWQDVAKGQGIVWSVGPDRTDDGGRVSAWAASAWQLTRGDILGIVPP